MADQVHYDYENHKRKYEDDSTAPPPSRRRSTGFSDVPPAAGQPQTASYNHVPPPMDEFLKAKQSIQQLASRAFSSADPKRSKFDNNGGYDAPLDQKPLASNTQVGHNFSNPVSHSYDGGSKKIEIPNGRVGVIIGKAGETIKYLQIQSGARIQVTRDADHDPSVTHRTVELMGNPDQIAKAEQLIKDVIAEADAGGPGSVSRRPTGAGSEQFVLTVPNNKVGLVIGKGGETIKNIQATSGARVQVIPLHPPPGDLSNERTVQIDGTSEQIEIAKQMVNEAIENRLRNPAMAGGYSQQGYQARPQMSWAPQPQQVQQSAGYGYTQHPGAYPGAPSQYNAQNYSGYPPQPASGGGYAQNWEQSNAPQSQQASQGTGYDYYGQHVPSQQQQQQQPPSGAPAGNSGYNYNQQQTGYGQQGYSQDGYGGAYNAPPAQPGYGQPPANPQSGYDQQHGYGSTPGYGSVTNAPPQDGHPPCGAQGETGQAPPQQGYTGQPSPNLSYPTPGANQTGYGMPPTSQSGYGTPSAAQGGYTGYAPPQGQRTPPNLAAYGQPQQSPSQGGGYTQPSPGQPGYPPSQSPAQTGYGQPDAGVAKTAASPASYGGVPTQPVAYPPPYGAPQTTPPSYGQPPAAYYGGAYSQPPAYPTDGNVAGAAPTPAPAPGPVSQPAPPSGAAKASPQS